MDSSKTYPEPKPPVDLNIIKPDLSEIGETRVIFTSQKETSESKPKTKKSTQNVSLDEASQNQIRKLENRSLKELEDREADLKKKLELLKIAKAKKAETIKKAEKKLESKQRTQILICASLVTAFMFQRDYKTDPDKIKKTWNNAVNRWSDNRLAASKTAKDPEAMAKRIMADKEMALKFFDNMIAK